MSDIRFDRPWLLTRIATLREESRSGEFDAIAGNDMLHALYAEVTPMLLAYLDDWELFEAVDDLVCHDLTEFALEDSS